MIVLKLSRAYVSFFAIVVTLCSSAAAQEDAPQLPTELKQKVDNLIQKLGNENYAVRESAQKEIETLLRNAKTFDALLSHLSLETVLAEDIEVKFRLNRVTVPYFQFGITSAILEKFPDVIEQLTSPDLVVRWQIVHKLGELALPDTVTALVQAYRDGDMAVGMEVLKALDKISGPRAVEPLVRALSGEPCGYWLRDDIVRALSRIGEPAVRPLVEKLKDTQPTQRARAAWALGEICHPDVV